MYRVSYNYTVYNKNINESKFWKKKYLADQILVNACIHVIVLEQEYYWWIKYWQFNPNIANRQN